MNVCSNSSLLSWWWWTCRCLGSQLWMYSHSWNTWHSLVCLLITSLTISLALDPCPLFTVLILHHSEIKESHCLLINRPLAPVVKILIDHTLLLQIVTVSAHLQFPLVYTPLYLLAFFSFLRISNILPHTAKNFDKTRHLCVGDVVFAFQRATIVVKWSKTLQDRVKTTTVDISYLGASALCPIAALERMLATHPAHPDSPLFQIPQADLWSPLTD